MMSTYPGSIPSIPSDGSWTHDQVAAEIEAIATELGVNPSGSAASVGARLDGAKWPTGVVLTVPPSNDAPGAGTLQGDGWLTAMPVWINHPVTLTQVSVNITTAAVASTVLHLGAYSWDGLDGTNKPQGTLIHNFGNVAVDSTGIKALSGSWYLDGGLYLFAVHPIGGSPSMMMHRGTLISLGPFAMTGNSHNDLVTGGRFMVSTSTPLNSPITFFRNAGGGPIFGLVCG